MQSVDQGTIIYGMYSEKYPELACYGIIISARCDVANCKVRRFYYVNALRATDWLVSDVGFTHIFESAQNAAYKELDKLIVGAKLHTETLVSFDRETVESVLNKEVSQENKRKKILEALEQYKKYLSKDVTVRKEIIKSKQNTVVGVLRNINDGDLHHLYYLPQVAYNSEHGSRSSGFIVDLQEIDAISIEDIKAIWEGRIYCSCLDDVEIARLSRICWLKKKDDFVEIEGTIDSPWREQLMQRFSNSFIRIGVDGATKKDLENLVSDM